MFANLHMPRETIRCLIIDDNRFIQHLLEDKLIAYFPQVDILGICGSGQEGLTQIRRHQPDLIFLDIEMSDMTGFELLELAELTQFETIFITSFSHYAIKAIRFNALDYLVKPIDLLELKKAMARYEKRKNPLQPDDQRKGEFAFHNRKKAPPKNQVLLLRTHRGELRFVLKDIIHIEADRNYCHIYLADQKKCLVSKTLLKMEELLGDKDFFRCHKSHLVNIAHVHSLLNRNDILLDNEMQIPLARRKKTAFLQLYNQYVNQAS